MKAALAAQVPFYVYSSSYNLANRYQASVGNLGGFLGPNVMGWVEKFTGSFVGGLYYLCISMLASASIIFFLGLGKRSQPES